MTRSKKGSRRFHVLLLITLLSLFVAAPAVYAGDCEVLDREGELRSCTFTEEVRECWGDVLDSWEQCMDDAADLDGWFETWVSRTGCEAGYFVNMLACLIDVTTDWLL